MILAFRVDLLDIPMGLVTGLDGIGFVFETQNIVFCIELPHENTMGLGRDWTGLVGPVKVRVHILHKASV